MSKMNGAEAMVCMLQIHGIEHTLAHDERSAACMAAAAGHGGPTLVGVITQPLHEANAPVSEWIS